MAPESRHLFAGYFIFGVFMKTGIFIWIMFMCSMGCAHANQFNTNCTYSHTLPDDAIVYPGKPGEAMVHDFFGNTNTNALSTPASLTQAISTTCDSAADPSAYWAPQLKRGAGIISPMYEKTYYKNDQPVVPVSVIPAGLEMLAGDHMGTARNPHINFLCASTGSYVLEPPKTCPPQTPGGSSQFNISVHFPDCWDGKNLVPILGSDRATRMKAARQAGSGQLNVAYRNSDGTCPGAYPVKIPELQLNIAYDLGTNPDLSDAQLSMDPVFQNGQWVPQWGSLYTAHGDFMNAWRPQTMQYLVDTCMNKPRTPGSTCDKSIPTYYSAATANVQIDSHDVVQPAGTTLVSAPGSLTFIQFPMPAGLGEYPYANSYLQSLGGNVTDAAAIMLELYAAHTDWDETTHPPTASSCDLTQRIGGIYMDDAQSVRLNDITGFIASQRAAGASQIGICIRNTVTQTVRFSSRTGPWTPAIYLK
jgi:hypothetical protein